MRGGRGIDYRPQKRLDLNIQNKQMRRFYESEFTSRSLSKPSISLRSFYPFIPYKAGAASVTLLAGTNYDDADSTAAY